jgi:hypothetical protein
MKVWGVASEDDGSRERCRQAPMDGITAFLDRRIPYLLFLDGFSIKREYMYMVFHCFYPELNAPSCVALCRHLVRVANPAIHLGFISASGSFNYYRIHSLNNPA